MKEFAINWLKGGTYAEVTVPSGTALKSKLLKLSECHPEEVNHIVENKDGSMVCHIPVSYIKISPPRKVSDEQKTAARERFQKMWADKKVPKEKSDLIEELDDDLFLDEEEEMENGADKYTAGDN